MYTVQEKLQIIKWIYGGNSYAETIQLFIAAYEDRPAPSKSTISRIHKDFETKGSVLNCKCTRGNNIRNINEEREARDVRICAAVEVDPSLSSSQIAEELGHSKDIVKRVLKKHGYKSFKISCGHELCPGDEEQRMNFCASMIEKANNDDNFLSRICFTDESTFPLLGRHNPSVVRFWSRTNPRRRMNLRTQYPQKLNVWAGMIGGYVLGPIFIEGNLTGQVYLNLLQEQVVPLLQALPDIEMDTIWYQQDGCPAHNAAAVRTFLQEVFPNRIIANRWGTVHWPARSPDLAPNDFFFWGAVKQKVYRYPRVATLEELREQIVMACNQVTAQELSNMRQGFYNRLGYCSAVFGAVFEHLL